MKKYSVYQFNPKTKQKTFLGINWDHNGIYVFDNRQDVAEIEEDKIAIIMKNIYSIPGFQHTNFVVSQQI